MDVFLLAVILAGCFVLIYDAVGRLFFSACSHCTMIYPVSGQNVELEWQLRCLLFWQRRLPCKFQIQILDCGMDDETRAVAQQFQRENKAIIIIGSEEPFCTWQVRNHGAGRKSDSGHGAGHCVSESRKRI